MFIQLLNFIVVLGNVMANQVSSPKDQQTLPTACCWEWSIRPLILWIRILGVDLPDGHYRRQRWWMHVYGGVCFSSHAISQCDILYFVLYEWKQVYNQDSGEIIYGTVTATWNWIVDFMNYAIYGVGMHFMLLTLIRLRWNRLKKTFRHFQMIFTEENYVRIRQMSSFSVIYAILMPLGLAVVNLIQQTGQGASARRLFISFMSTLSVIYPATALVAYAIHCYASSLAFELIQKQIKLFQIEPTNGRDLSLFIQTVKRKYIAVCESVDAINHCFGWMLLLSAAFVFVAHINSSFYLFSIEITINDLAFLSFALIHATLMFFSADRIRCKAEDFLQELLRLKCDEKFKEFQMNMEFLILDTVRSIPQISASGYFSISKRLFPKLIGTTLTYFFILYEFQASEKKL